MEPDRTGPGQRPPRGAVLGRTQGPRSVSWSLHDIRLCASEATSLTSPWNRSGGKSSEQPKPSSVTRRNVDFVMIFFNVCCSDQKETQTTKGRMTDHKAQRDLESKDKVSTASATASASPSGS